MPLYPHRLPGESRPGVPLPPHPSDKPPPPKPKYVGFGPYTLLLLRESAFVVGGLCTLMVLPWP